MYELAFTIEFNGRGPSDPVEADMFAEAERRLRALAEGHDHRTGAAVNVRQPTKAETAYLYEVTVVVYARPEHVAATEKQADPARPAHPCLDDLPPPAGARRPFPPGGGREATKLKTHDT